MLPIFGNMFIRFGIKRNLFGFKVFPSLSHALSCLHSLMFCGNVVRLVPQCFHQPNHSSPPGADFRSSRTSSGEMGSCSKNKKWNPKKTWVENIIRTINHHHHHHHNICQAGSFGHFSSSVSTVMDSECARSVGTRTAVQDTFTSSSCQGHGHPWPSMSPAWMINWVW